MRGIDTITILAVGVLAFSNVMAAQGASSREAYFRCKDARGVTQYGDSVPRACLGRDTEVLNDHGTVMRVIEGEHTRATRLAREAKEAEARRAREEREQRDRMLIETYLNVEDIERLRDQRLELLASQYRVTEQNIVNLRERQQRIETQVARFKPYSEKPNAPPLPDHLAEEMVNTVNGLRVYEESLVTNRQEQAEIRRAFDSDIQRFKELKGLR